VFLDIFIYLFVQSIEREVDQNALVCDFDKRAHTNGWT
jgi:hypothetical protein